METCGVFIFFIFIKPKNYPLCGNYGALKCLVFCETKNFGVRRRRRPAQDGTNADADKRIVLGLMIILQMDSSPHSLQNANGIRSDHALIRYFQLPRFDLPWQHNLRLKPNFSDYGHILFSYYSDAQSQYIFHIPHSNHHLTITRLILRQTNK